MVVESSQKLAANRGIEVMEKNMTVLDERRTVCPQTLFHAKRKMEELAIGEVLKVLFTDNLTKTTMPQWAELHGHRILGLTGKDGYFEILIEKGRS